MIEHALVVAPHPDDETLGCGGTLLKLKARGVKLYWLIITSMHQNLAGGDSSARINAREKQIFAVRDGYGFDEVVRLDIPAAEVDRVPTGDLIGRIGAVFSKLKPDTVFLPFANDAHSDHYHTSKAALSCCKWFRYPFIKNVLFFETISETDFNINAAEPKLGLNVYVDISEYFERKMELMQIFKEEMGEFPFPRSREAIESLAKLRGAQCGALPAEAFELLRGCF